MPNGLMEIFGMSEKYKSISNKVFGNINSFYGGNIKNFDDARKAPINRGFKVDTNYGTLYGESSPLLFSIPKLQEIHSISETTKKFKFFDLILNIMGKEETHYRKSKSVEEQRNYQTNKPYDILTEEDFARHAAFLRATIPLAKRQIDLEPDFMDALNELAKISGKKKPSKKIF